MNAPGTGIGTVVLETSRLGNYKERMIHTVPSSERNYRISLLSYGTPLAQAAETDKTDNQKFLSLSPFLLRPLLPKFYSVLPVC